MRWRDREQSSNIEDRRGASPRRIGGLGGLGGIGIVIALVAWYFGADPSMLLQELDGGAPDTGSSNNAPYRESQHEAEARQIAGVVLRETEIAWQSIFSSMGAQYREPHMVLFTNVVESACGTAESAVGPFYCPADQEVYLDLSFYDELKNRFGAPGDFAQAYVIAHEVGHHVQNLIGTSSKVHEAQQRGAKAQANALSVRLELQADCYAGIWAHFADASRHFIEPNDIDEGLAAASAIGDDRLQMQSRGYVSPESFTHGTSEQRVRWFKRGYTDGKLAQCDTFSAAASSAL